MQKTKSITLSSYIYRHVKPFWAQLCFVFAVAFVDALVPTCHAFLMKKMIDLVSITSPTRIVQALTWPIVWYLLFEVLMEIMWRCYGVVFQQKMMPQLRANIISSNMNVLLKQSYGFYQKRYAGQLTDNVVKLSENIPAVLVFCHNLFSMVAMGVLNVVLLSRVSWHFGMLMYVWIALFFFLIHLSAKPIAVRATNLSRKKAKIYGRIVDVLTNILSIKLFARKRHERYEIRKTLAESVAAERNLSKTYTVMFGFLAFFYLIVQGLSMLLLVREYSFERVTAGDFVLVLNLNNAIATMFWFRVRLFLDFAKTLGQSRQALKAIHQPVDVQDHPQAKAIRITDGEIALQEVTFRYAGTAEPIFNQLSLHIPAGQKVGLVGYSGGGKSTLVKLLLRLHNIHKGVILVDGQDIAKVTQASLRLQVGLVPQQPVLFHRSIGANIHCVRPTATKAAVIAAARKAQAHAFITNMPQGYNTIVGEGGSTLSGGQRQRIAMARAILANPRILLLDEATSNLDAVTEQYIQSSLETVMEGKTTIVIAHRLSTLLKMDRIIVMKRGAIVEDGTHTSLLAKQGRYHELWHTQVNGFLVDVAPVSHG